MKNLFMIATIMTSSSFHGQAAEFCVKTNAELQAALNDAAFNLEDDVIKLKSGTYQTLGSSFNYIESNGYNLDLSGGWSGVFVNTCDQQLSEDYLSTILDGNEQNSVLKIGKAETANITLSNLAFINGVAIGGLSGVGGGLFVYSTGESQQGSIMLENTIFINNQAGKGGAARISGGFKTIIRNNAFVTNHSINDSNVNVSQHDSYGVIFTNNTAINNTTATGPGALTGGIAISVSGSSNALIANNLLWDNDNGDLFLAGDSENFYLMNNNIELRVGVAPSVDVSNISLPPQLETTGFFNFTPSAASPLINKGTAPCTLCPDPIPFEELWTIGDFDVEGNTRDQQGHVDIGAVESPYMPDLIFMNGLE